MNLDLSRLKSLLETNHAGMLLEGFDKRRRTFERRMKKAQLKPSEKAVHEVRIAARRLISLLAVIEHIVGSRRIKRARSRIKEQLDGLGAMRDVQVQKVYTRALLTDFPQLISFHKSLCVTERRLRRRARMQLRRFNLKRLIRETNRVLEHFVASIDPDDDRIGRQIGASLNDAFSRVLVLRARIDPDLPRSIHRTRLAFKKFRYTAEIAAPQFEEFTDGRLQAMHDFQDRMGTIQDLNSLLDAMMDFRRRSGRTSLLVVENELRRRRRHFVDEFVKSTDEIRFFLSNTPAAPRESLVSGG